MLRDQYSFPCHLAKDSTPFFHLIGTPRCNPGKSADLSSSFQEHLIKVHRTPPIVKPPGISLWIRAHLTWNQPMLFFIWNVPSWKRTSSPSWLISLDFEKTRAEAVSCPHSNKESELESDLHEIFGWGLQKINGLKSSCLILWLSQLVHPQKNLIPFVKNMKRQGCYSRWKSIPDCHN